MSFKPVWLSEDKTYSEEHFNCYNKSPLYKKKKWNKEFQDIGVLQETEEEYIFIFWRIRPSLIHLLMFWEKQVNNNVGKSRVKK